MKRSKICIMVLFLILLSPVINARAAPSTTDQEYIYGGNSAFYLFALNASDTIQINVSTSGDGDFDLYLLNTRPDGDNTNMEHLIGDYPSNKDYVNFTATAPTKLYYLQVKLQEGEAHVFWLTYIKTPSSPELLIERFYLLQLPGFPIELLVFSLAIGITMVYVFNKRKRNQFSF